MTREEVIRGIRQDVAKLRDLAIEKAENNFESNRINTIAVCIYGGLEDLAVLDRRLSESINEKMEEL